MEALEQLKQGVRTFQQTTYPPNAEAYQKAATTPQTPHTLMITCSDSRIDIETVCNAKPGELFIARNVGNVIPAHGVSAGTDIGAVVEYAVNALKVKHIVVCGHADCGAMKALLKPESLRTLPSVEKWLEFAARPASTTTPLPEQTEANVRQQIEQLRTHPAVADATKRGDLTLSGWVYEIGSGEVRVAPEGEGPFEPIKPKG